MSGPSSARADLRQLRYWLTVVEEQSFNAAAKRLHISQPSLSQQVKALERTLGGALLERHAGGVRLTPAGRALLPEARAAIAAMDRAVQTTRQALGLEAGVLHVATLATLPVGSLLPAIVEWHRRHSHIQLRLREFPYRGTLEESVAAGICDLGIGVAPRAWGGPVQPLGWEQLVVVLPPGDALLGDSGPIDLADLADRRWICYAPEHGLARLVDVVCGRAGFNPERAIETTQVEAAARLAAATGAGPALVPHNNLPPDLRELARPLRHPVVWQVWAYSRGTWSPSALSFLEMCRTYNSEATLPPDAEVIHLD